MDTTTVRDGFEVGLRPATAGDEPVVMSAWLRGHRDFGDWPRLLHPDRYFAQHKVAVAKLLARGRTEVACNPARPSQVFGFICHEGRTLHWLYVKDTWRTLGIARALWVRASSPDVASHWTSTGRRWLHVSDVRYDPFALEVP